MLVEVSYHPDGIRPRTVLQIRLLKRKTSTKKVHLSFSCSITEIFGNGKSWKCNVHVLQVAHSFVEYETLLLRSFKAAHHFEPNPSTAFFHVGAWIRPIVMCRITSLLRSFPSRVLSPTPANTENHSDFAILLINSWIKTVLLLQHHQINPILPPFA
jgi:hypothetical protein